MTDSPHDKLFKAAFETPRHAASLFRGCVPPELAAAIDWDSIQSESGSFINDELKGRHADLLFSARAGDRKLLLYLLIEHQSTPDKQMPLRMLEYLTRIWIRASKDAPDESIPFIVPLVVTHAPGGWTEATSLRELFDQPAEQVPGLAGLLPTFDLLMLDLGHLSNEEIKTRVVAAFPQLALWALRDSRSFSDLMANFEAWDDALKQVIAARSGSEAFYQLMRYAYDTNDDVQFRQFRAKIIELAPEAEETMLTIAERLRQEGLHKGKQEMLLTLLREKFGELSAEHVRHVEDASDEEVERLSKRVLTADSLAAVFGG